MSWHSWKCLECGTINLPEAGNCENCFAERGATRPPEDAIRPAYYGGPDNPFEVIKVMEEWDPVGAYYFCRGTAIKYLPRAGCKEKDPTGDLRKSSFYSERAAEIWDRLPAETRAWLEARP